MFSKKDFQTWAKDNVVLFASIMTRIEGRKDDALLSEYGFRGFPSLALLDAEGEIITKKVSRDLPSMKEVTKSASTYVTMKAKVDAGEEVDQAEWLMARMGMGLLTVDEAKEAMADVELSDAQAEKMDTMLVVLEVETMMSQARSRGPEAGQHPAMIYKMWKSNRKLPAGHSLEGFYMAMLLQEAENQDDGKAFLAAYPAVRKQTESQVERYEGFRNRVRENQKARLEQMIEGMKKRLEDMDKKAEGYKKG